MPTYPGNSAYPAMPEYRPRVSRTQQPVDAMTRGGRAVEGAVRPGAPREVRMSPTNWIIANNDMVHRDDNVRLCDGREGVIVRVSPRGRPVVQVSGGGLVEVHPQRIAVRVR